MTSSWKALGRTLEIITIVLLVLAVGYLWVDTESEDTSEPQIASPPTDADTETVEHPYYPPPVITSTATDLYQPPAPILTDTSTYQQPTESSPSVYVPRTYIGSLTYASCSYQPVLLKFSSTIADPPEMVEKAIMLLDQAIDGHRDELADDQEALFALINEILLPRIDRRYSAQLILGKNWRDADESQRERFINAFYNSLFCKYASAALDFDFANLQVLAFRGDLSKKRTIVKTIVSLNDGTRVIVDFGFANRNDAWKMFDVTIDGISYIRNYRAELDAEIRATSLDAVIERLEAFTNNDAAE
jgi:phospholipid transport system substrate-binding protein